MKILILLLVCVCCNYQALGQNHQLFTIEKRLIHGDKDALFELASYFDKGEIIYNFPYEREITMVDDLSKEILKKYCLFTEKEVLVTRNTSTNEFIQFLKENFEQIIFDKRVGSFLITPLESRGNVEVLFRKWSPNKESEIKEKYSRIIESSWVKETGIDILIEKKDAKALLEIASIFYKTQNEDCLDLLHILLGYEFAIENTENESLWRSRYFLSKSENLKFLIYFIKNYNHFQWDEKLAVFKSPQIKESPVYPEEELFELLGSTNNSIAMDAFVKLTNSNTKRVIQLANTDRALEFNDTIPRSATSILRPLVFLTQYCKENQVDFVGSEKLQHTIKILTQNLPFKERRRLEDSLIHHLTLEDITTFEYWAFIFEKSIELNYSVGRILDVFYSKNWDKILGKEKQLLFFLKKSYLFNEVSVIGYCHEYLKKFAYLGDDVVKKIQKINTQDKDIQAQIEKAKNLCLMKPKKYQDDRKYDYANKDYRVFQLAKKIRKIKKIQDSDEKERKLSDLLPKINYHQIGEVLKEIEGVFSDEAAFRVYLFMRSDWGLFIAGFFEDINVRKEFLEIYSKFSEYEVYEYYLDKAGIDFKKIDKTLDYDRIYEILKYNIYDTFVGGGYGKREIDVYPIIKLLELTHRTRLGYPKKLCNSHSARCASDARAYAWMEYLIEKKLLKKLHQEPISFGYPIPK